VFKKNLNTTGQVEKFKARLVAKGYSQVEGVNFSEILSPVENLTSIRVLMSLVASFDLELKKMVVKTTFLHGDLEEKIYMKQYEGFAIKGNKYLVYKLKRSLSGLKKTPRMWYQHFDTHILRLGFVRSKIDHCVYSKEEGSCFIYALLYVDDMLLVENIMDTIKEVKNKLSSKFNMKDIGVVNFILGMKIKRDWVVRKLWLN
jgi:hypothetical protein